MALKHMRESRLSKVIELGPMLYIITTIAVVALTANVLGLSSLIPLLMMIAGYPVGAFLSRGVTVRRGFFGKVYYRGSNIIFIIWLIAIVARVYIFIVYPTSVAKDLTIDVIYGFFAGILVGGTSAILRNAIRLVGIEDIKKNW